ncbi:hypothetical protein D3C78_1389590 [compost metagenome]
MRQLAQQENPPPLPALVHHLWRHAGFTGAIQPVEQPDVIRESQRRDDRPIIRLKAHKRLAALERRLPQHPVGFNVRIVTFDVVIGVVENDMPHSPAVGIQPQGHTDKEVKPVI